MRHWRATDEVMVEDEGRWTRVAHRGGEQVLYHLEPWKAKCWFIEHGIPIPPELVMARPVPTPRVEHEGPEAFL